MLGDMFCVALFCVCVSCLFRSFNYHCEMGASIINGHIALKKKTNKTKKNKKNKNNNNKQGPLAIVSIIYLNLNQILASALSDYCSSLKIILATSPFVKYEYVLPYQHAAGKVNILISTDILPVNSTYQ